MKARYSVIALLAAGLVLISQCTKNPIANHGTGSTTETAMVKGTLYQSDGITPAVHATVHLRKKSTLADTSHAGLLKSLADTASVTTNDSGIFRIDTIDTGTYVIEGASGNNLALNDSVPVKNPDSTVTLPPDTLKPAGAIKGIIRLSEGGDPRKVFILAFGIDRFARVNADGSFKFSTLAEGKYDLRLISSLDNYGVLDTNAVPVISADTTDLDTISLPFTGIPTPKNVMISYDTLKQIVTLTWSKADTALVKSYNVYRRNVDSNTVAMRINASPVADTVFKDSTGVQGTTYEFMIAAVNKSTTEGTKSAGVSVKEVPLYSFVKGWGSMQCSDSQFCTPSSMTMDKDGNLYITNRGINNVVKYDTSGHQLLKIGSIGSDSGNLQEPWDVEVDQSGQIFVADYGNGRIQGYDPNGKVKLIIDCDSAEIGFVAKPKYIQIDSFGNIYAIVVKSLSADDKLYQALVKYNSQGAFISATNIASLIENKLAQDFMLYKGNIYITATSDLYIFKVDLSRLNFIHDIRYPLAIGSDSLIYCGGSNIVGFYQDGPVKIVDQSGNIIARFGERPDLQNQSTWSSSISASLTGLVVDKVLNVYTCEIDGTNYVIKKFKRN